MHTKVLGSTLAWLNFGNRLEWKAYCRDFYTYQLSALFVGAFMAVMRCHLDQLGGISRRYESATSTFLLRYFEKVCVWFARRLSWCFEAIVEFPCFIMNGKCL